MMTVQIWEPDEYAEGEENEVYGLDCVDGESVEVSSEKLGPVSITILETSEGLEISANGGRLSFTHISPIGTCDRALVRTEDR